ncbi:DUF397 domain-containing protein [Streptomyces sp. ISL-10]|uniref:DUF397 domain-containing protein n=1 Tax=Streptomyces sp. ISL-10 TaxID=2819172 RepID=UPI001BE68EAF|nr:DUF397 domain-containing protein [Streptomyces sp. ISL-10]MBT2366152.1 DUF397 domain-containing protein [Streptomyces sp. ISL-10]
MMRHDLPEDRWHKSSYSTDNGGNCVQKQKTADGYVAAGDSKNRQLGAHAFAPAVWQEFVTAVADGKL